MENNVISKNQFQNLFDNKNDTVMFLEKKEEDYKIIYANNSAKYMFSEKIEEKFLSEILPKSRYKLYQKYCHEATRTNGEIESEEYVYEGNKFRKYNLSFNPIESSYILLTVKEVDVKKELEDKNILIRSIFNNSFLSTLLLDRNCKLLDANSLFLEKFNLTLENIKNKNILELSCIEKEDLLELHQDIKSVVNGEYLSPKQFKFLDDKGDSRQFTVSFCPLTLSQKQDIDFVLIVMQEITKFQKQEKALKSASQFLKNYRRALNSAAEISITDEYGRILDVNDRFVEQSGYTKEELIGQKHSILNSRYHTEEFFKNLWSTIKKGKVWRGEIRNITKYGTYYWNDCTIVPLVNEDGEIKQFLSVNFNITEKKSMISELRNIEHMFRLITENTNDLIVIMNQDGIISYVSAAYERKLGYTKEEMVGQFYTKLLSNESKQLWNDELALIHLTENRKIELIHKTKDNIEFWTECNYTVVRDYIQNKGSQIIMVAREISERKEFENKLLFLAYHDALTQLPNRRYIFNEFPAILENAKKRNESVAVLYVDGDNFKQVNDQFGHNIGDKFIYEFGRALSKSVRSNDVVSRIGGDEFVLILTGLSINQEIRKEQLGQIIHRIKKNLQTGWKIDDHLFKPTASIGVAFFPDHGTTLMELLENSDKALYDIKFSSKNNYKIFDKEE